MWNKGFTLIELIITIAVIGVMAAILIPALTHIGDETPSEVVVPHLPVSVEETCINGTTYLFVRRNGNEYLVPKLDQLGNGVVSCQ